MTIRILRSIFALWAFSRIPAMAVNEKGEWPWNLKLNGWHDRKVTEEMGTVWSSTAFSN